MDLTVTVSTFHYSIIQTLSSSIFRAFLLCADFAKRNNRCGPMSVIVV